MKKIIALLAISCIFRTFAQSLPDGMQATPQEEKDGSTLPVTAPQQVDYSRKAIDLIAFPNAREVIAGVKYFLSSTEYKLKDQSQNYSNTETEIEYSGFDFEVAYAFDDYLGLSIEAKHVISSKTKITNGPETIEYKSSGIGDPVFSAVYRAMDISRDRYDMNLSLHVSPKMQDVKEDATTGQQVNNAKGRTDIGVEVEWGRRVPTFSWSVGLKLDNSGKAEFKDSESGDITTIDSYGTFGVSSKLQWAISPKVAIDLNLTIENMGDFDFKYADGSTLNYDNAAMYAVGGTVKVTLQDKNYLTFDLMGVAVSDRNVTDEENVTLIVTERREGIFTVGIITQF